MIQDTEEYVESILVDVHKKTFKVFSNFGDEKTLSCDNVTEFMNVLQFVRDSLDDSETEIYYVEPKEMDGVQLSLVERRLWEADAVGSNPITPTDKYHNYEILFCGRVARKLGRSSLQSSKWREDRCRK